MPSRRAVLREYGPADVARIPNAAACDRRDRPGGRQTRMNAPPEPTEELNSFQRAGRAPPEDEFGRWHSTDRLPPGQDPVGGLEIGCRRDPGHKPHPLLPNIAQLREVVQPDRLRAPAHDLLRQVTHRPKDCRWLLPMVHSWDYGFDVDQGRSTSENARASAEIARSRSRRPPRVHGFQIHR